jgi:thiamine-monophosphate kinase
LPTKGVTEAEAISTLSRHLNRVPRPSNLELGIGDDAAVLRRLVGNLVCSIDCSAEGVHFDLTWLTLAEAAARALVAAVSDLAAMGSRPVAALVNLEVPANAERRDFDAIGRGQRRSGVVLGCPIIGGNIVRGTRWVFTTTVLGGARRVVRRDGAHVGDEIWLIGDCGLARVGLVLLQRGLDVADLPPSHRRAAARCLKAWKRPTAKLQEGVRLVRVASALIDVSDGLANELGHLAHASDARLVVYSEPLLKSIPSSIQRLMFWLGLDPLETVLTGGEDYALLATGASTRRPDFARAIGEVRTGKGAYLETAKGLQALRNGFDHLA